MLNEANFCMACGTPLVRRIMDSGQERPVCPSCGRVVYFDPKVAVSAFITEGKRVLLIRRGIEPQKGLWALPAGFIEGSEDPELGAAREALEETGLIVEVVRLLDVFPRRGGVGAADITIGYEARIVGGTLLAGDDAVDVQWFEHDQIPELAFDSTKILLARWQANLAENT
jgi:8-oxo-dGTP diphosphatase